MIDLNLVKFTPEELEVISEDVTFDVEIRDNAAMLAVLKSSGWEQEERGINDPENTEWIYQIAEPLTSYPKFIQRRITPFQ